MSFENFLKESKTAKEVERILKREGIPFNIKVSLSGSVNVIFGERGKELNAIIDANIIDVFGPKKEENTFYLNKSGLDKMTDYYYSLWNLNKVGTL